MYQLDRYGVIRRLADKREIPPVADDQDYQVFLARIADDSQVVSCITRA